MKRRIILTALAALLLAGAGAGAQGRERVEVAFVLDSTGSMGGLIEGAKQKIWSIANSIIAMKPTPEVRIGLVSYRDRGDEYVTRRFDLTEDIDEVFRRLQSFTADGGGDEPESVNQALNEAVRLLSWSKGSGALRIVFLVGDCPPHMDYRNDVKYALTCREAAQKGIIINTVQCGGNPSTVPVWQEIARLAEGSYVALEQAGGMTVVSTPFDERIGRLNAELNATVVLYGEREMQEGSKRKLSAAESAPAAVAADRAAYNLSSGGKAIQGRGDLVADVKEGTVDLSRLPPDQLPAELRRMSPGERHAWLAKKQAERDSLNRSLEELVGRRAEFLEQEQRRQAAAAGAGGGDSFDRSVALIIAEQARRPR